MGRKDAIPGCISPEELVHNIRRLYCSPMFLIAAVAISVFASEVVVMVAVQHLDLRAHPHHHILVALLLLALLFPALILLVFRPLTLQLARRRRAEEELAAERNKLKQILDAIPAGVCIINQNHGFEYVNSTLTKEFGPVRGRFCYEYFHGQPGVCPDCKLEDILEGLSTSREWLSVDTGKTFELLDTPLRNSDGSTVRLVLVRDITARKQAADELRASRKRLRSLSDHLQKAREEERTAISREIHDELGQVLATVQLGVSSLADEYRDHRRLVEKTAGMAELLRNAIKTVQKISSQLRPSILDELGLADAIEWQASEFAKLTSIRCDSNILLSETNIDKDLATAVFRICQEALTNVMRHSGATSVMVSLEERNGRLVLMVADNGRGITAAKVRDNGSLGITGMRERAYALGGRVRICRFQQWGTVVIAHIPVAQPGG